jgi:hypothetical protein
MLLLSAACVQLAVAELVLTLDSKDWTMMNENGTLSLKTNVPAYPLEVLRSQGVIGDPLYRWVTVRCCCCGDVAVAHAKSLPLLLSAVMHVSTITSPTSITLSFPQHCDPSHVWHPHASTLTSKALMHLVLLATLL